ncbi:hypothetical protein BSKO_05464 [Bryopsis sp. KO-2023]|nr:hypothetical protein BSKO_05464 [Bryopsis sp. KO-2023]
MGNPRIASCTLFVCCLVVLAAGRNLSQEYGEKANEGKKPCRSRGRICRHGFKCGTIKGEECTKVSGFKSVCSKKEVCLKEGAKCGDSICTYNEKCVKDPNCGLSRSVGLYDKGDTPQKLSLLDGSCFSCQPETGYPCEAVELNACVKSECEKIKCEDEFEEVCKKVPQKICKPVEKCQKRTREECEDVPEKTCKKVSKPDCDGVPEQECKPVLKDKCELKGVQKCKPKKKAKDAAKKTKCKMVEKCNEYSKTVCSKGEDGGEQCLQVPVKDCKSVKEDPDCVEQENGALEVEEEECEEVLEEVCEKVEEQECKDVVCFKTKEVEECMETTKEECKEVEFELCSGKVEEECTTEEKEECKKIPKKSCTEKRMKCRRDCIKKSAAQCKDKKGIQCGDVTCEVGVACGLKCEVVPTSTETCQAIPIEACVPE